ncbi:MAG: hypothetical protein EOP45_11350 [Sphingobacteriaceae bacterium]|nr:MAG: hypothetical protein EOP45_11350 [Sphingobacteriaceae bacterium]
MQRQSAFYNGLKGNTELDEMNLKMCRLLGKKEEFYQQNMAKLTNMSHERLPGGLITDLSNQDILIEIKNAKKFRESFGQVNQYALFRPKAHRVICLFGHIPNAIILRSYIELCEKSNIDLVWLFSEELYCLLKNDIVL